MVDGQAGKGDTPRPVDKKKYDRNYLRIYGEECKTCNGTGIITRPVWDTAYPNDGCDYECYVCNGLGYIEKAKK